MSNIKTDLELNSLGQQMFKSASTPIIWYSEYFIGKDRHLYKKFSFCPLLFFAPFKVLEYLLYSSFPLIKFWYTKYRLLGAFKIQHPICECAVNFRISKGGAQKCLTAG